MSKGKQICKELKSIRRTIADENGIALDIPDCTYSGACDGTCPRCEAELQYLEQALSLRIAMGKAVAVAGLALGLTAGTLTVSAQNASTNRKNKRPVVECTVADTCLLRGEVLDSTTKEPLIAANVIVKKDGHLVTGANTDSDGKFEVRIPKGEVYEIEIRYIGYESKENIIDLKTDTCDIKNLCFQCNRDPQAKLGMIPIRVMSEPEPQIEIGAPENGERIDSKRITRFPN